jgi:hypothetical protein
VLLAVIADACFQVCNLVLVGLAHQACDELMNLLALRLVLGQEPPLLIVFARIEVAATDVHQLILQQSQFRIGGPVVVVLMDVSVQQRVGGHELRLQVRQCLDAVVVVGIIPVDVLLLADEGDEEPQPGDEHGDGLDVDTIDARLDEVEFARIVGPAHAVVEGQLYLLQLLLPFLLVVDVERPACVLYGEVGHHVAPPLVVGVHLLEDVHHLLQHAHGEGTGATGRVKNLTGDETLHDGTPLVRGELHLGILVAEELAVLWFEIGTDGLLEVLHETLVDHVLHNLARGIERAALLACRLLRLGIVVAQEVLEDLAQELRVEGHLHVLRRVLLDGEHIAVEDREQTALGIEEEVVRDEGTVDIVAVLVLGVVAREAVVIIMLLLSVEHLAFVLALEEPAVEIGHTGEEFRHLLFRDGKTLLVAVQALHVLPVAVGESSRLAILDDGTVEGAEEESFAGWPNSSCFARCSAGRSLQGFPQFALVEDAVGHESFLLDEPHEEHAGDESYDFRAAVFALFLRQLRIFVEGDTALVRRGRLIPLEEVVVELFRQHLRVEHLQHCA